MLKEKTDIVRKLLTKHEIDFWNPIPITIRKKLCKFIRKLTKGINSLIFKSPMD